MFSPDMFIFFFLCSYDQPQGWFVETDGLLNYLRRHRPLSDLAKREPNICSLGQFFRTREKGGALSKAKIAQRTSPGHEPLAKSNADVTQDMTWDSKRLMPWNDNRFVAFTFFCLDSATPLRTFCSIFLLSFLSTMSPASPSACECSDTGHSTSIWMPRSTRPKNHWLRRSRTERRRSEVWWWWWWKAMWFWTGYSN